MSSRVVTTFTDTNVETNDSHKPCYVYMGRKVYDAKDFAQYHPGGAKLILAYAGKDVESILKDPSHHHHSDTAYEIMEDLFVGYRNSDSTIPQPFGRSHPTATGVDVGQADNESSVQLRIRASYEADLYKETDLNHDYEVHRFMDLSQPLFPQIWFGGSTKNFYLDQVHRPRHLKDGQLAPLFGNFPEPLSKTSWWVIPTLWLPPVVYGTYLAGAELETNSEKIIYWTFGLFLWSLIEYSLHPFMFHIDKYYAFSSHSWLLSTDIHPADFPIIALALPPTSFSMAFTTTFPWTRVD